MCTVMAQRTSCLVLVLDVIVKILLVNLTTNQIWCTELEPPVQADKEFVEKFINDKANQVLGVDASSDTSLPDDVCGRLSNEMVDKMSELAVIVSEASTSGAQSTEFQDYLARELNVEELADKSRQTSEIEVLKRDVRHGRKRYEQFRPKGLKTLLIDSKRPNSPFLVNRHYSLGNEGQKELLRFTAKKFRNRFLAEQIATRAKYVEENEEGIIVPEVEQRQLPEWLKTAGGLSKKAFDILLKQVLKNCVFMLDQLYASPYFLEHLPIIGQVIVDLKNKGKPVHNIIKAIRSSRPILEMDHQLAKLEGENGNSLESVARAANTEPIPIKLINQLGQTAIQLLAAKLLSKNEHVEKSVSNLKEIGGRFVYFIMMQIAPKTARCILSL